MKSATKLCASLVITGALQGCRGMARLDALSFVLELLEEITVAQDGEPLTRDTRLDSLGLESINLVYLIAEVQHEYGLGDGLIATLRAELIDIRLLTTSELAAMVERLVAAPPAPSEAVR